MVSEEQELNLGRKGGSGRDTWGDMHHDSRCENAAQMQKRPIAGRPSPWLSENPPAPSQRHGTPPPASGPSPGAPGGPSRLPHLRAGLWGCLLNRLVETVTPPLRSVLGRHGSAWLGARGVGRGDAPPACQDQRPSACRALVGLRHPAAPSRCPSACPEPPSCMRSCAPAGDTKTAQASIPVPAVGGGSFPAGLCPRRKCGGHKGPGRRSGHVQGHSTWRGVLGGGLPASSSLCPPSPRLPLSLFGC